MLPVTLTPPGPLRLLCIGAHCDDIEIGCGGTLLRLVAEHPQVEITWVVMTSTSVRERETRQAAAALTEGATSLSLTVHRFRDGFLPSAVADVKEVFEGLKVAGTPNLIISPWRGDAHQDHRLLAELTWNTFRDHTILEYEIVKYDGDLGHPNLFVPLDRDTCVRKIEILRTCFRSQLDRAWFDEESFRSLLRLRGIECNAASRYAEAFHVRKLVM